MLKFTLLLDILLNSPKSDILLTILKRFDDKRDHSLVLRKPGLH